MKILMACIEDGLDNIGFRKIASYVKSFHADTEIVYVPTGNLRSLFKTIIGNGAGHLEKEEIFKVARILSESDLILL